MLGVSAAALRYYEKEGMIPEGARDEQGRREYKAEQIEYIQVILMLRRTGMSVDELKNVVKIIEKGDEAKGERVVFMLEHKKKIEEQIAVLICI
ncbi:MerR family transcriptional regulator [Cytobacillus purgationiresistens]|nr:MerR family transcriptional regulator [Cytobacillus purgationiresistens]